MENDESRRLEGGIDGLFCEALYQYFQAHKMKGWSKFIISFSALPEWNGESVENVTLMNLVMKPVDELPSDDGDLLPNRYDVWLNAPVKGEWGNATKKPDGHDERLNPQGDRAFGAGAAEIHGGQP